MTHDHTAADEQVVELATNLDDVTGEVIADTMQALLEAGALDVWATPIVMKFGRPAVTLSVLCHPNMQKTLTKQLHQMTGTLGIRYRQWERNTLERQLQSFESPLGTCQMKVAFLEGEVLAAKPELRDAQKLAHEHHLTVREAIEIITAAWRSQNKRP